MAREGKARLGTTDVLSIIVTDGELRVRSLFVAVVDNANIAAAEYRPFIGVVSDRELSKIEVELFTHVQGKDEGF